MSLDVGLFARRRKYVDAADVMSDGADVVLERAADRLDAPGFAHTTRASYDERPRMNRPLIVIGIVSLAIGLLWKPLSALPLFRLPGDFVVERPGFRFYFPLASMLLISGVMSLILWLFRR